MSEDDIQRLYDSVTNLGLKVSRLEALLTDAMSGNIDASRLRWDGKAINYIISKVVAPVIISVVLSGSAFYYGISKQVDVLSLQFANHVQLTTQPSAGRK